MSLAQGRSARQIAPNSKQQALAKLANLKQGGLKRTDQFQVRLPPPRARSPRRTPHTTRSHALVLFCAPLLVSPQAVEEEDIYDDLNEDEYQELVKKRREDNFIEDDDGNGYVDFGQDDWDDAEYSGDEEEMRKRAKGEGGEARKKGVFNNLAPKKKKVRACCCVRLRACCLRPHVHAPHHHLTLHPSLTRTGDRARERHVPRRGP